MLAMQINPVRNKGSAPPTTRDEAGFNLYRSRLSNLELLFTSTHQLQPEDHNMYINRNAYILINIQLRRRRGGCHGGGSLMWHGGSSGLPTVQPTSVLTKASV